MLGWSMRRRSKSLSGVVLLAWVLWSQDSVLVERWWIPTGWPFHWTTVVNRPYAVSEFRSLEACKDALGERLIQNMKFLNEESKKPRKDKELPWHLRVTTTYACVPFPTTPRHVSADGTWD